MEVSFDILNESLSNLKNIIAKIDPIFNEKVKRKDFSIYFSLKDEIEGSNSRIPVLDDEIHIEL